MLNRRHILKATSSAVAAAALAPVASMAQPKPTNELRVSVAGGDFAKAFVEAYVKPFEAETGVKVTPISQNINDPMIATMVTTKNVSVDVCWAGEPDVLASKDYVEKVDYSLYRKDDLAGIAAECQHAYGVAPYYVALLMVYNTNKFPSGSPQLNSWSDFWDTKKFPGVRSLSTATVYGALEEALIADGVPVDKLYPLDLDRAFVSLDKIKPHVRKWWNNGSEILQMMRDGAADVAQIFDGRAVFLIDQGAPIAIVRNQSKSYWDYMAIPKGSPNVVNAQKFLETLSRSERQADFAKIYPQAPSNRNAYKHLPENIARKLCTYPEYASQSFNWDKKWLQVVGADGQTNRQRIVNRWNQWILS